MKRASILPYHRADVSSILKDTQNALLLAGSDLLGLFTPFIRSILCFQDPFQFDEAFLNRDAAG